MLLIGFARMHLRILDAMWFLPCLGVDLMPGVTYKIKAFQGNHYGVCWFESVCFSVDFQPANHWFHPLKSVGHASLIYETNEFLLEVPMQFLRSLPFVRSFDHSPALSYDECACRATIRAMLHTVQYDVICVHVHIKIMRSIKYGRL